MPVIPLPELGVPVPVCSSCFQGDPRVVYYEYEGGHRCHPCLPMANIDPPHPWPVETRSAVIERTRHLPYPSSIEVTYHNLCGYADAALAHPHLLPRIVSWLQTHPAPDLPEPRGHWLGTVGSREEFTLRLDPPQPINLGPSDYGDRFLFRFRDGDGNAVVWFSGEKCWVPDGWSGTLKATVKEHSIYAGERQTIIQRGKELTRVTPEAPDVGTIESGESTGAVEQ